VSRSGGGGSERGGAEETLRVFGVPVLGVVDLEAADLGTADFDSIRGGGAKTSDSSLSTISRLGGTGVGGPIS